MIEIIKIGTQDEFSNNRYLRGYERKYAKLVYVNSVRWRSGQTHCCYVRTWFTRGIMTSYFFSNGKKWINNTHRHTQKLFIALCIHLIINIITYSSLSSLPVASAFFFCWKIWTHIFWCTQFGIYCLAICSLSEY